MKSAQFLVIALTALVFSQIFITTSLGDEKVTSANLSIGTNNAASTNALIDVQKYNRSIHIMAMLLVGFGFLMVFVKRYGLSAVTATYLLVSVAIPVYLLIKNYGQAKIEIDKLILAEFAAASLLICAGAVLGRLKMAQYILLAVMFIPSYMLNEWIIFDGGLKLMPGSFTDTGGSIVIHAFGALFGLGVIMTMTTKKEFDVKVESDETSNRFSMVGSMVLWLFWPSFCAALVSPELIPVTAVNVVLALCGATIATYFATVLLRGKISIGDIANAALAGGVAIGSTCDKTNHVVAFIIGILAGVLSTFSFAYIQTKLQNKLKVIDTCGVLNLHGFPGLMGGFAAMFVVADINRSAQLIGIIISIVIALVAGLISGKILSAFGRRAEPYFDTEEFIAD
jgi:ammonium transporter Rh